MLINSVMISYSKSKEVLASAIFRQHYRYFSSISNCRRSVKYGQCNLSGFIQVPKLEFSHCCWPNFTLNNYRFPELRRPLSTSTSSQQVIEEDVRIQYRHGLPTVTLTLPSRNERCEFALRPITQSVAEFCDAIRREDKGVDVIGLYRTDGVKISGSTSIEHLMQTDFHVRLNDKLYLAQPPKPEALTLDHVQQLNEIKTLVVNLHAALNADEQCLRNQREVVSKLESIKESLEPLEKQKRQLALECEKRTTRYLWIGLALMGVQIGAFARLTWFEYSWDIMEPVTYFTTYAAVISGYAYFVATRTQYEYPDAKERMTLNRFYKLCRKRGFDVEKYNRIKETAHQLEQDLERLRRRSNANTLSRNLPLVEQTITFVRDDKTRVDKESVANNVNDGTSSVIKESK